MNGSYVRVILAGFRWPSGLSDLSPPDVSPALEPDWAELSLRNRRDRLLDIFLRTRADPLMVCLKMERGNGVELCMGPRFVAIDHDTPLLLPPNLRDWVPCDHLEPLHPGCR